MSKDNKVTEAEVLKHTRTNKGAIGLFAIGAMVSYVIGLVLLFSNNSLTPISLILISSPTIVYLYLLVGALWKVVILRHFLQWKDSESQLTYFEFLEDKAGIGVRHTWRGNDGI